MSSDGSVTRWIDLVRAGDSDAAEQLWQRYFQRLVALARKKLLGSPRRAADEEDVALSAFDSFCRNAAQGRFPRLLDRDGLWRLLVVFTVRKAARLRRDEARLKRGGGATVAPEPAGAARDEDAEEESILDQVLSREPTPEVAAQTAEECRRLLGALGDRELEAVARGRLEGYTVEEIASRFQCASSTVKRKLQLIRGIWEKELARE